MKIDIANTEAISYLKTAEKLELVNQAIDPSNLGLTMISAHDGKSVFFDNNNKMYWSVWNTTTDTSNMSDQYSVSLLPAHEEADFAASAQIEHFILSGRTDLATQIIVKHTDSLAVCVIPEIPGINAQVAYEIWENEGRLIECRPINNTMFAEFVSIVLQEKAPVNADIAFENMIIGFDRVLYACDFSLEFAGDKNKPQMIGYLFEMAVALGLKWNELPVFMRNQGEILRRPINEESYLQKVQHFNYLLENPNPGSPDLSGTGQGAF